MWVNLNRLINEYQLSKPRNIYEVTEPISLSIKIRVATLCRAVAKNLKQEKKIACCLAGPQRVLATIVFICLLSLV